MFTYRNHLERYGVELQKRIIRAHRPLVLMLNFYITTLSLILSLGLRFDFQFEDRLTLQYVGLPLLLLYVLRMAAYSYFRLNQGYWRYVSTNEAVDILKAHSLSSLMFIGAVGFLRIDSFPRSIVIIEFVVSLLLSMGARLFVRIFCEKYLSGNGELTDTKDVVVIGAGVSGHLLAKTLNSLPRRPYRAVAFFDDNDALTGSLVNAAPVVGPISLLRDYLQRNTRVSAVIVAIPLLSGPKLKEIEDVCNAFHLPLKRIQSFEDIACQEASEPKCPISIEQVLSRDVFVGHEDEIRQAVAGKRVLVTGAGGSIGSELARQVLSFNPSEVVLLDQSEYNLFNIEQELNGVAPNVRKVFRLATIVDPLRLERIFAEHRPQIIFHAAAYKHVPLLESNSYEAFMNNIVGTRNLLRVARAFGAERFVMISTDKAVDPSSLMGCTKRIAELMVGQASMLQPNDLLEGGNGLSNGHSELAYSRVMSTGVVRFGNVINSAGSVIPVFKKQILAGGPITVTHPKMERFFMSISEAVRLVLTAGALGDQGEIYLLDMGRPIKILDVAEKLLALYGRRDIPIVFTGLRPGEKLTERLHSQTEAKSRARFKKIFVLKSLVPCTVDIFAWIREVEQQLPQLTDLQIEAAIRSLVVRAQHVDQVDELPEVAAANGSYVEVEAVPRLANA